MKSKKVICIVSLLYLLIHFPVNLMSQDLFVAKEDLIVFKQADSKSDTTCTIHINDKVEVVEIKKVWLKKWAKIQNSKGILGYVPFNKLKPIETNQEIQKKDNNNEDSTQNTVAVESDSKVQSESKIDSYKEPANISNENTEKNQHQRIN